MNGAPALESALGPMVDDKLCRSAGLFLAMTSIGGFFHSPKVLGENKSLQEAYLFGLLMLLVLGLGLVVLSVTTWATLVKFALAPLKLTLGVHTYFKQALETALGSVFDNKNHACKLWRIAGCFIVITSIGGLFYSPELLSKNKILQEAYFFVLLVLLELGLGLVVLSVVLHQATAWVAVANEMKLAMLVVVQLALAFGVYTYFMYG